MNTQPNQQSVQANYIQAQIKTIQNHSNVSSTGTIENSSIYFDKCLGFLESKGKELFGDRFKILNEDHEVIYKLLVYVTGDEEESKKLGLSLKKGILLTGPIGCGKTSLMKLLRFFQPSQVRYDVRSCRDISFSFIRDGYEVIHHYTYGPLHDPFKVYCFDDLGTESNLKYYGNECNVLGEILLTRYELFVVNGMMTHCTTNCNSSEIEHFYGNRVRSRMREMFNLIPFEKEAKDKR